MWGALVATAGYLAGSSWHTAEHYLTGGGVALTLGVVASFVAVRLARRVTKTKRW